MSFDEVPFKFGLGGKTMGLVTVGTGRHSDSDGGAIRMHFVGDD